MSRLFPLLLLTACTADTITATGTVVDAMSEDPILDYEVCFDTPDLGCTSSNAEGEVTLEIPTETDLELHGTADDYFPQRVLSFTRALDTYTDPENVELSMAMFTEVAVIAIAFQGDVTLDDTKGHIAVVVPNRAGATATLSPESGERFYAEGTSLNTEATGTDDSGGVVFFNVDPGDYAVDLTGATDCAPGFAWTADSPSGFSYVPVHAGELTALTMSCAAM